MKPNVYLSLICSALLLFACGNAKKEMVQIQDDKEVPNVSEASISVTEPEPIPEPEPLRADPDFSNALSDELRPYFIDVVPDTAEVQIIEENVAVEITISDVQLAKWRAQLDEEGQQEAASDIGYYTSQFSDFLEEKVKVVQAKSRYLYFKGIGNNRQLVDLEKDSLQGLTWTYVAFNTTREPKLLLDLTSPDTAFTHYINQDITPEVLLEDLDAWNLPNQFARQDAISDEDFWQFLLDYRAATDQLNSTLYHRWEIMYYDHSLVNKESDRHPLSIVLEREAFKRGYLLKRTDGRIYFGQSAEFIRDHLLDKLTTEMEHFLDAFLIRYEDGYWNEGLIVSPKEIAQLIVSWEQFQEIHPDFIKKEYAVDEAALLVAILIQDDVTYESNFSKEDSVLMPDYRLAMEHVIERVSETLSGLKIKEYYDLLSRDDFKKTAEVEEYLKRYREERSNAYRDRESVK